MKLSSSKVVSVSPSKQTVSVSQLDLVIGFLLIGLFQFCLYLWGVALFLGYDPHGTLGSLQRLVHFDGT